MVNTTISISTGTRDILRRLSLKGESYDEIISEMSRAYKKRLINEVLMNDENCITLDKFKRQVENMKEND